MNRAVAVAALLLMTTAEAAAEEAPAEATRRLTFEEAMQLAMNDSLMIDIGRESIVTAESRVRATRTYRLPSLGIKANVFVWNDSVELSLGPDFPLPPNADTTIREQVTGSVEVSVVQPITAAVVLGRLIELEQAGVTASEADLDVHKLDLAYQAAEIYLGALQMGTLRQIAETSVVQLEANIVTAQALKNGGILSDVDILRLEAGRDAARQAVLEAEVAAETGRRALGLLLNLPDGTELELVDVGDTTPELGWTEDEAVELARKRRPEAKAAAARAKQADIGIDVARAQYLPSVVAIASYTHSEGQGNLAAKDSAFIGVSLEWNLWDWGERKEGIAQARSLSRAGKLAQEAVDDTVTFEVRSQWLAASAARKTLDVTASGLRAAEEANRLQGVLFDQGAATTTDVLAAQSEVSRARAQATIAHYQYLTAWMALARAVGQMPSP